MLHFFFEGLPFYKALRESIDHALFSIDIEVYTLASDNIGWEIAELLAKKASQGVIVRVSCDKIGSRNTSSDIFEHLRQHGIQLKLYNPVISLTQPDWRRDHRKLMIIDKKIAYMGGFNLASDYITGSPGELPWRDTGIKITNLDLVSMMTGLFENVWAGHKFSVQKLLHKSTQIPDWENHKFHILPYEGWYQRNAIRAEYRRAIKHAYQSIYITNPYFVPDRRTRRMLCQAAMRGVDVRIITAGNSDVPIVKLAGRTLYTKLLEAGISIYEYSSRILHAKSAVIDNHWFTIGSSNLDHMSLFKNLEINFFGHNTNHALLLNKQFEIDLRNSRKIDAAEWKKRPWWQKVMERFFYYFRKWL